MWFVKKLRFRRGSKVRQCWNNWLRMVVTICCKFHHWFWFSYHFLLILLFLYYLKSFSLWRIQSFIWWRFDIILFFVSGGKISWIKQISISLSIGSTEKIILKFCLFMIIIIINSKLFLFRLACLCASHMIHAIPPTNRFNTVLLADIIYFYAFTHTYFSAHEYKSHVSEEISVCLQ